MARTKQTAKKSTGGANPRAQLVKKQALAAKGPAYSATKGPAYSIARAYNVAAGAGVVKKKGSRTKSTSTGAPAPRVLLGAGLPVLMSAGVPSSTMPSQFPGFIVSTIPTELDLGGTSFRVHRIMSLKADENFGDTVCYVCQDGGRLFMCGVESCQAGLCGPCLNDPSPELEQLPFMCPQCHRDTELLRKADEGNRYQARGYEGFQNRGDGQIIRFTRGLSARSTRIRPSPKSVLLLVYALEEFPLATTPIPGLVHFLNMLLPLNFASLQVNFDLSTDEGSKSLELANEAIAESLMNGALQSIQKIFVIIVSHTTPDFGDIHIAPNHKASSPGNDVMTYLLPQSLLDTFTSRGHCKENHIIAFMTCGFMFTLPQALSKINDWLVTSNTFYGLIAFAAQKFQPAAASHFLQAIIREFFIHDCLGHSAGLGSHSGVIYLRGDNKNHREYLWAHPVRAPFGVPHALSCLCGIVDTLERLPLQGAGKSQDLCAPVISLRCRCCDWVGEFIKPEEFTFTRKFADNGIWGFCKLLI
ncbi:hypothetical protein B0H14DRAFT_3710684 [Mycena olivaceomarginata]|nr:hypothetical protein B0H14DRAFT_3710684 [Mycena olivaceomarginata]